MTADIAPVVVPPAAAAPRRSVIARLVPGTDNAWIARGIFVAFAAVIWFLPNIVDGPAEVRKWAEFLCYAILAVGLDIAWGYGGMLVLGQGVFFGLGAYSMGMHLTLENVPAGSKLPSFMSLYGNFTSLPLLWRPFQNFWFAAVAAIVVPAAIAALLGALVFTRRVRGPYFALLTQATALVFSLILIGNLPFTAGFNGLTGFNEIFGRSKYDAHTNLWLYRITAVVLLVVLAIALKVVRSRYGRLLVATRDSEPRVRFLGYNPALVQTVAFAISAAIAGIAGALAAPVIGIVSPNQFAVLPSILFVCWVAVGGRGTLWGAAIGALLVNWLRVSISNARPDDWSYLQGALFVIVLAVAPGGLIGVGRLVWMRGRRATRRRSPRTEPVVEVAS